jgi:hypothetical protein
MQPPPEYPSDPQQPPVPPLQMPPYTQHPPQPYPPHQPYPPQPGYPPYQQPPRPKKKRSKFWLIVAVVIGAICVIGSFSHGATSSTTTTDATSGASTQQATVVPTKAPPTPKPPTVQYPPKTIADLHGLAAQGTVSAIHEFHSESVGMTGACPQPKRFVTVDPGVKDRQLTEDLLAYFYGQQLDSPCGAIVFAYHNQGEANDVFTAGRIKFDVTDASGADNFDPNATGLTHKLTLDVGGLGEKEYIVTY